MAVLRLLCFSIAVAVLLLLSTGGYYAQTAAASQKEHAAPEKRTARFHYVCPMHADVTSTKRGSCNKCKMALVKKRVVKNEESNSGSGSGAHHQH